MAIENIIEEIKALNVMELADLVKAIEEEFGVSAAAPVAVVAGPAVGAEKIKVIKAVREITGLGLADAKALVDGAPKTIKEAAPKEEADAAKAKLEEVGAKVELK